MLDKQKKKLDNIFTLYLLNLMLNYMQKKKATDKRDAYDEKEQKKKLEKFRSIIVFEKERDEQAKKIIHKVKFD